jgi:hypothetical protein
MINGPKITIDISCYSCAHVVEDNYVDSDGAACKVSCSKAGKLVGISTWQTPEWCPLAGDARNRLSELFLIKNLQITPRQTDQ